MNTPASRLDSYPDTVIRKLSDIRRILLQRGVFTAIQLGDFWHANTQSPYYINQVCEELVKWKESGIQLYIIVGNHEIANEKPENLIRNPLQILFTTGIVKHLRFLQMGKVAIRGFDYTEPLEKATTKRLYKVCVAHRFYEFALSDQSLTEKNIKYLNYDLYLLGHDHRQYEPLTLPTGQIVQRPGSLLRGTSHSYQISREPSFDIDTITINDDLSFSTNIETVIVPYAPAKEVFTVQALKKPQKKEDLIDLSSKINALIDAMDTSQPSDTIYETLDKMDMNEEVRALITTYLTNAGVYRAPKQD